MAFDLGSVVAHVKADISDFQKGINQAKKELGHISDAADAGNTALSTGLKFVGSAAVAAGAAVTGAMVLASKASWDQVSAVQQATVALNAYEKDGNKVNKVLSELVAYARSDLGVLFNRKDLFAAAQGLKIMGDDTEKLTEHVKIMSRSVGLSLSSWDDLTQIIGRVGSTGRLTGIDFDNLTKAGFKLDDSIRNSDITFTQLFEHLDKGIPVDAVAGQANTIVGIGIRLQSAFRELGNAILGVDSQTSKFAKGSLGELLINALNALTQLLRSGELKELLRGIGTAIAGVAYFINKLITENSDQIQQWGQKMQIAFLQVQLAVLDATIFIRDHATEIKILASIITTFFVPALVAMTIQMGIQAVMAIAKATWAIIAFGIEGWKVIAMITAKAVQLSIATVALIIHTATTAGATIATTAMTVATWLLNTALALLTSPIFLVIAAIVALIAIGWLIIANWESVKAFGKAMLDFLVNAFWGFVAILKSVGGRILDAIVSPFQEAWDRINYLMKKIKDALDFTKRHSPSTLDIVQRGVKLVNNAFDDLVMPVNMPIHATAPSGFASGSMTNVGNIMIDMSNAIISDQLSAQRVGEKIGDSIISKLKNNIRF